MKKILFGLFVIIFTMTFLNCEKDDICEQGTPTTPRMIIEFYDNNNPTNKKVVTDLKIIADGNTKTIEFNNTNKIELPLKLDATILNYSFILNSKSSTTKLEDKIELKYLRKDIYISRACGFKSNFELPLANAITLNTPKNWIQEINILQTKIESENQTHVKIFF